VKRKISLPNKVDFVAGEKREYMYLANTSTREITAFVFLDSK
jgi:hypothetical protein